MRLKKAIIDHGVDIGNQKMMVGLTNVEYKLRVLSIHSWHVWQKYFHQTALDVYVEDRNGLRSS